MKQSRNKNCCLIMYACLVATGNMYGQNMTSPYSVYGVGNFDFRSYNRTSGLGHTGLALRSSSWLIGNNPATIASMEKSWYVFDLALAGTFVQFSGDPITADNRSSRDFGVKRAALAVKVTDHWASSIGFRQLSNVNYKYQGSLFIEGSADKFTVDYEGDGGLNVFYWTNALSIGKHLQAGVNLNVINGSVNRTELMSDPNINRAIETKVQDYYSKLRLEYGLLYSTPLNKQWQLSVGGRLAAKTSMLPERTLTVKENDVVFVDEELLEASAFHLPLSYGAGIALTSNNSFTIAADYQAERWQPLHMGGSGWSMVNSHRFSGGIELSRQVRVFGRPVERKFFQFGGFINNSNLSVSSNQITEFGITAGYGGAYWSLLYNVSLELGQRGTTNDGLIKENYLQVTIGLSYRDFLFTKGRKYE